jgi:NAD(P)-dependent dehydrogenase (short-subunit alcohol dehydrogenase family)
MGDQMELDGKRIIVTGGSRGIAGSAVRAFTRAGANVASLDLRDDLGEQVAREASEEGPGKARYYRCDISDRADVHRVFAEAVAELGGLDGLLHAAGIHREAPAEDITDEDWDAVLDVNLKGTFITNQEAFPYLRDNGGGRILNFGSGAALGPYRNAAHYSASKGAVISWSRTVAHEWGRHGITVNAIAPGIQTPMAEEVGERRGAGTQGAQEMHAAMMAAMIPIGGKLGDPDRDIAPVLVFLMSDGARFITAQIIPIDGGLAHTR